MAQIDAADRVQETTTTTGSGDYTLAGPVTGFQTFASQMANTDTCYYFAYECDANGTPTGGWETGLGTWGTGGILARTTIHTSSNANAAVVWGAGTRRIGISMTSTGLTAAKAATSNIEDICRFGDGSDGAVTISSGTTVLTREMYYTNLTISGTGSLDPNGFRILGTGILDLTNAPANAIQRNGASGLSATNQTGGLAPTRLSIGDFFLLPSYAGAVGKSATANAPTNATVLTYGAYSVFGGVAGRGGGTAAGSASAAGAAGTETLNYTRFADRTFATVSSIGNFKSSFGDGAGATGGGNGAGSTGGGSGGTGQGGACIAIYFKTINRGASTAAGCISSNGGNSGSGAPPVASGGAAGAGSGGAGGGFIQIIYNTLLGTSATNAVGVNGGAGGAGGADSFSTNRGAGGGEGGRGGVIVVFNATTKVLTATDGIANSRTAPGGVTGTNLGGTAGTGAVCRVNL